MSFMSHSSHGIELISNVYLFRSLLLWRKKIKDKLKKKKASEEEEEEEKMEVEEIESEEEDEEEEMKKKIADIREEEQQTMKRYIYIQYCQKWSRLG